ncbi:methylated-DNA--[protein]-cysteine S-methyltransferase [Methanothermobacter sp.]|uniref:methylated-DNA--[protein]-cysteine S-methyltransferase n=1 Tax=Methanothermobacter sp. TaxID=1884223 RepID=UPI003C73A815
MYILRHPLACVSILCGDGGVQRIFFASDGDNLQGTAGGPECEFIGELTGSLWRFLDGEEVRFDLQVLDWRVCTEYQRRVLLIVSDIPRGSTLSYAEVAEAAGGGARSAARALAGNPFPLIIPCHRVIRSDGSPGGYQGGTDLKRRLLEMEGAQFNSKII